VLVRSNFDEGQTIVLGDTIGFIDTATVVLHLHQIQATAEVLESKLRIASLQVQQASFTLALAQKEYDRVRSLIGSGSANQQQYDQAETAYNQALLTKDQADAGYAAAQAEWKSALSQVSILRRQFDDCFPTSPLQGIVVTRYLDSGELVAPGMPLVKIANLDTVWVKIYLSPAELTRIGLGSRAKIDLENGRHQFIEGKITWISDEAEFTPKNVQTKEARADLVYAVKVAIPNPGHILKIGMPVSVTLP
jgi:HlyD family secretion protein